MNEIYALINLIKSNPWRGYGIVASLLIIFAFLTWVSIIDIKKQSITFWKMLLSSSMVILCPLVMSLFCGCKHLKWFLILSLFIWVAFLYYNVRYNKDKFVGKADIDLLSALVAECIGFSIWLKFVVNPDVAWIKITHAWYSFFFYLTAGAIAYLVIFMSIFTVKALLKKASFKELIKGTKVSVIPMLMPVSIMVPFMVMIA